MKLSYSSFQKANKAITNFKNGPHTSGTLPTSASIPIAERKLQSQVSTQILSGYTLLEAEARLSRGRAKTPSSSQRPTSRGWLRRNKSRLRMRLRDPQDFKVIL